jgi:hypothetical protein
MGQIGVVRMRRSFALVLAGMVVGVAGLAVAGAGRSTALEPSSLRTARVVLRQDDLETPTTVAAWVPTGSRSRKCIVTLLESNAATYGQTIFCGLRFVHGEPGVWLHIFLPFEPPSRFRFDVAVYQQGAEGYGRARPCPGLRPRDPCFD